MTEYTVKDTNPVNLDRLAPAVLAAVEKRSKGAKTVKGQQPFLCPCHNDTHPKGCSYDAENRVWYCHVCEVGGGLIAGEKPLAALLGINVDDFREPAPEAVKGNGHAKPKATAKVFDEPADLGPAKVIDWSRYVVTYDYRDADGVLRFRVGKTKDKGFPVFQPASDRKGWHAGTTGLPAILYRLPELEALEPGSLVWITEGEKDANRLSGQGMLNATTFPGWCQNRWPEAGAPLAGHHVVVVQDNDARGRDKATVAAAIAHKSGAVSVRVLDFVTALSTDGQPAILAPGFDASDFLDGGGDVADLRRLASEAPEVAPPTPEGVQILTLADIEAEPITWLWKPLIPRGHLTAFNGDGGVGKSTLMCAVATAITLGRGLPDTGAAWAATEPTDPEDVLIVTAEDHWNQVLRARLEAMGADLERMKVLSRPDPVTGKMRPFLPVLSDPMDRQLFEAAVRRIRPALVILDPWQAFTGAKVDLHRMNESRALMTPLSSLAEEVGCAIVVVGHLTKGETRHAMHRAMGSADYGAAVRSMLLAGADPDNPDDKALFHVKSNLSRTAAPIGFAIVPAPGWVDVAVLKWKETSLTQYQVLGGPDPEGRTKLDDAKDWLSDLLADGPVSATVVEASAKASEHSWATVRRARSALGVEVYRPPAPGAGRGKAPWFWRLDAQDAL